MKSEYLAAASRSSIFGMTESERRFLSQVFVLQPKEDRHNQNSLFFILARTLTGATIDHQQNESQKAFEWRNVVTAN